MIHLIVFFGVLTEDNRADAASLPGDRPGLCKSPPRELMRRSIV